MRDGERERKTEREASSSSAVHTGRRLVTRSEVLELVKNLISWFHEHNDQLLLKLDPLDLTVCDSLDLEKQSRSITRCGSQG